jgi:hypothetical protein
MASASRARRTRALLPRAPQASYILSCARSRGVSSRSGKGKSLVPTNWLTKALASSIVSKDCSASRRVMSDETFSSARRSATGCGSLTSAEVFLPPLPPAEVLAFPEALFLGMAFLRRGRRQSSS